MSSRPGRAGAAQLPERREIMLGADVMLVRGQAVLQFDSKAQQQLATVEAGLKAAETSFRRVLSHPAETNCAVLGVVSSC